MKDIRIVLGEKMARKKLGVKISAVLAISALLVSACSSSSDEGKGGTVTYLTHAEKFLHLDPQRNYTGQDLAFSVTYLTRSLVSYNTASGAAGTELVADLATDTGTPSEDLKTWTFTLRDGITFEDGSPITCAEVAYGVSRSYAADITDGPAFAEQFLDIEGGYAAYPGPYEATAEQQALFDAAVECSEDGKTITFHLNQPMADFNYTTALLTFSPVPLDEGGNVGEAYDLNIVSSGPYKIDSYTPGKSLNLVRNDNWNPDSDDFRKALPDKVVVKFAQDERGIDEYIINGTGPGKTALSLDGIFPENLEKVFSSADMESRRLNDYDIYVTYTAINVKKMTCLPIRQAVFYALDREAIRALGGGSQFGGDFADGVIKPATLPTDYKAVTGYEDAKPAGNVEKAQSLMDQAKTECPDEYTRVTTEGIVRDYSDSETNRQAATITTEALAKVGIKLVPNFIDAGSYYGVILNPETQGDLSAAGWGPDWLNASTVIPPLFIENGGFNVSQTQYDPDYEEFKALVDEAKANADRPSQGAQWAALNQFVMDHMWVIPGLFTKTQYMWGSDLTGVYLWAPYGCPGFNDIGVK